MNMCVSKVSNANLISECQKRLNKIGKITMQSVAQTDRETCEFLRKATPARLKELAKMNCFAANKVKTELDRQFGKNNYVLIAIGRSVSSITETLGHMGVDTKIIPLSGLRRREVNDIPKNNLHSYKCYLVQIGLSKTDLKKNKDKKYILMDYAYYGRTLDKAEQLLKNDEMLGNAPNLISMRINDILGKDYNKKQFKTLFEYNRFKDYSFVGRLHIDNLKDVYNQCLPERVKEYQGNITKGLRKLFWFNVFKSLNEKNYEKINPVMELNALYEHYLSQRALKIYIRREFRKEMNIVNSLTHKK